MASLQKKLAAKILKVGESRIWLNPAKQKDVNAAITRIDIKKLIKKGEIKVTREKISRPKILGRKRRRAGSKKGAKHSIVTAKRKWIQTVRPLRKSLRELKDSQHIDNATYKQMRKLIKGGMFRSRSHLKIYLEQRGMLKKKE
jgi:large subunit ribosomal protein L19e